MVYRIELERNYFRMEKIRIITESASDMGTPEREDVTVLPMHITFRGKRISGRGELKPPGILQHAY